MGTFELKEEPMCLPCKDRCSACENSEHNCTACKGN